MFFKLHWLQNSLCWLIQVAICIQPKFMIQNINSYFSNVFGFLSFWQLAVECINHIVLLHPTAHSIEKVRPGFPVVHSLVVGITCTQARHTGLLNTTWPLCGSWLLITQTHITEVTWSVICRNSIRASKGSQSINRVDSLWITQVLGETPANGSM